MSFGGLDFIFDGQYSENYGLKIMSINGSSITTDASAGCGIEVFSDWVYRNPSAYHQGVAQNQPLEFDIEFVSEDELPGIMRSKINKWLFGRMNFCKLQIVQRDLQDIYFNCHLIDPQLTYIGNYCHGIKCRVQCDAPWAWQSEKEYRINNVGVWRHYNDSDDTDYTYPVVEFMVGNVQDGTISVKNLDDNGREFRFEHLDAGEIITVDCRNQILKSEYYSINAETGESVRVETPGTVSKKFNKKFFRLVSGLNRIEITGNIEYFKMKYSNARKVGG